ncbi:hypothetical protein [Streptomyces sp. NPDC048419]|uniref:hypothetical protein n=1 Tax=Streptomyces sp. NPDC048419 TaxID=3365547 RepID=UPI0037117CA4
MSNPSGDGRATDPTFPGRLAGILTRFVEDNPISDRVRRTLRALLDSLDSTEAPDGVIPEGERKSMPAPGEELSEGLGEDLWGMISRYTTLREWAVMFQVSTQTRVQARAGLRGALTAQVLAGMSWPDILIVARSNLADPEALATVCERGIGFRGRTLQSYARVVRTQEQLAAALADPSINATGSTINLRGNGVFTVSATPLPDRDGPVHALDSTRVTVTGGCVHVHGQATVAALTGGEVYAFDDVPVERAEVPAGSRGIVNLYDRAGVMVPFPSPGVEVAVNDATVSVDALDGDIEMRAPTAVLVQPWGTGHAYYHTRAQTTPWQPSGLAAQAPERLVGPSHEPTTPAPQAAERLLIQALSRNDRQLSNLACNVCLNDFLPPAPGDRLLLAACGQHFYHPGCLARFPHTWQPTTHNYLLECPQCHQPAEPLTDLTAAAGLHEPAKTTPPPAVLRNLLDTDAQGATPEPDETLHDFNEPPTPDRGVS